MKKIWFWLKYLIKILLRFVFSVTEGGRSCCICGKPTFTSLICETCQNTKLSTKDFLTYSRCKHCGKILVSENELCMQCREEKILNHIDFLYPLYSYRLWNKELMFLWKTKGERSLSPVFAKKISEVLNQLHLEIIVPVPPRPGKIAEKGWDQIDELCQFLRFVYDFKICNLLERKTHLQQKQLDRQERLKSIGSSYAVRNPKEICRILKDFNGKVPEEVCLLDDVCTTGATIESCGSLLKQCGVKRVFAVTLFSVD